MYVILPDAHGQDGLASRAHGLLGKFCWSVLTIDSTGSSWRGTAYMNGFDSIADLLPLLAGPTCRFLPTGQFFSPVHEWAISVECSDVLMVKSYALIGRSEDDK